ncbi:MAG: fibronectin type III domain-containing protein [Actinomycetota bacterium]
METPFGSIPDDRVGRLSMAEIHEELSKRTISRRTILKGGLLAGGAIAAGPVLWRRPGFAAVPPAGRHLAFGTDPRHEMSVSWSTAEPVEHPVVDIGLGGAFDLTVAADTWGVRGTDTTYHQARVSGLEPATTYTYRVRHDGGESPSATFHTAPAASETFTFTSFGDQGVNDDAAAITALVEKIAPAFQFHVGDICYAYRVGFGNPLEPAPPVQALVPILTDQSVWDAWLAMVSPQAARAPWMTTVGNHEMEYGYGPLGYDSYSARFALPQNGPAGAPTIYSFRYGNAAFIALDGNDSSHEIRPNRNYTAGAQEGWLRATLIGLRSDPAIDFIVAGFHNCSYCTNIVHGSDAGPRERWGALFDEFTVDLVVNGHNHQYERTHPIRGGSATVEAPPGATINPETAGTTYITAGGGGQLGYQASTFPLSAVTIDLGLRIPEVADWSATRYLDLSLIAVDVAPRDATGVATMTIKALTVDGSEIERITLRR